MSHLIKNHAYDVGSEPTENGNYFRNGFAPGFSSTSHDKHAICSHRHLETLRESEERGGIQDHEIKFLGKRVEESGKAGADQIGGAMGPGAGRKKA